MGWIIPMIIQTIGLDPFRAVWTDSASNLSSLDPVGAIQIDAEDPSRNRMAVGSNPSSASTTPTKSAPDLATHPRAQTCTINRSTTTYPQRANAAAIGVLPTSVAATISVAPPSTRRWLASNSNSSA